MAGITDVPFRALAWEFGAGYVVGEMVSAKPDLWATAKSRLRRRAADGVTPVAVQIAGGDPSFIAAAARRHWLDGAQIIDINFGCPAKKVCRKAAGSALLADSRLVADIISAAVRAVPVPVTVKIRTGCSPERKNGVEIAKIAQAQGACAIAVHGRTRACRFSGHAEYDTIAAIKAAVGIPVFANGDIVSAPQARSIMRETDVDGVMIGRAALGAPWLPGQIAGVTGELTLADKLAVVWRHVRAIHEFYGLPGTRIVRKHVKWYVEKLPELGCADIRRNWLRGFNELDSADAQLELLSWLSELAA
jgi:tRNA-dihydrouridine synthase B